MIGKNALTRLYHRRVRILVATQAIWLTLVCVLGAWWGTLALRQARRVADLQLASGMARPLAEGELDRTRRMLFWESTTYYSLILFIAGFLYWLQWKDMRRTRSVQAFFASVTHELRTPLTSIRLQAESIAENLHDDPAHKPLLDRLLEDTQRLEAQVERTLELARVEGGGEVLLQAVPLNPLLSRLLQSWSETHGERLRLDVDLAPGLVAAADPAALQVVLRNLLENSLRHSRAGGARNGPVSVRVRLGLGARPNTATLVFEDDGGGFSGDPRRLGELFHRGAASQGSGVGLYLVQVLMRRMSGDARFSNGDRGFRVELALALRSQGHRLEGGSA